MTDPTLTPMEQRLWDVSAAALAHMPDELVAECQTLAQLDPSVAGIRVHHIDGDVLLVWVGRVLARINRHWLVTGEAPRA